MTPRAYNAIVLMGPLGSGKSHLGRLMTERGLARYEELEAELIELFGRGAEFAARKAEALEFIESRLREQLAAGDRSQGVAVEGQTAGALPVAIQSTGLSDREILLRLTAGYRLFHARLNTPRETCLARVQSRPQGLHLNDDPEYAARFHDYWHREVAPLWSFEVELSGVDAEADIALLEAVLSHEG